MAGPSPTDPGGELGPLRIRGGRLDDLDLLVWVDAGHELDGWTDEARARHRHKMRGFLDGEDTFTLVLEAIADRSRLGMICASVITLGPDAPAWSVVTMLPAALLPARGRLCEVFQLWVDPRLRRRGWGSRLKLAAEREAADLGACAIYTHSEHEHVVRMNIQLGYRELRRGPLWDEVERVSLIKPLGTPESV